MASYLCLLIAIVLHCLSYAACCPTGCQCDDFLVNAKPYKKVVCTSVNLDRVPAASAFPNDTYFINLSWNRILILDTIESVPGLKELALSFDNITKITSSAFSSLPELEHLDLNGNHLEELPQDVFANLTRLKVLNLEHNHLPLLDLNIFTPLVSLEVLHLSQNPLKMIKGDLFRYQLNLNTLRLADVELSTLGFDTFYHTRKLEVLDISSNRLDKVPNEALRATKIKTLILDDNPIEMLGKEDFTGLYELRELHISRMSKLTDVRGKTFSDLRNLKSLTITENPALTYIHPAAFNGMYNETHFKLEKLHLHDNLLSTLDEFMLPWCRIRELSLVGNRWTCDCRFRWIKTCSRTDITAGVRCGSPDHIKGFDVTNIDAKDFFCPEDVDKEIQAFRRSVLVLFTTMLIFLAVLLVILVKRNEVAQWLRHRKGGPGAIYYVKAHSNPVDIDM